MRELEAAPADVGMIGFDERNLGGRVHGGAGFRDDDPVDADLAGEDQRPRALARNREASIEHSGVKSRLLAGWRHVSSCGS
jgi:hypothetical protein